MIFIIVIAMIIIIAALYGNLTAATIDAHVTANIVAEEMVIYHAASARTCASSCSGDINPTNQLPSFRQNRGNYQNGTIRSFATPTYVVTYYEHPFYAGNPELGNEFHGRIVAAISEQTIRDSGSWSGAYDLSSRTIRSANRNAWRDSAGGTVQYGNPVTIVINSVSIKDGAPVIVNQK